MSNSEFVNGKNEFDEEDLSSYDRARVRFLSKALQRHIRFYEKVELFHCWNEEIIREEISNYLCFLHIIKLYPNRFHVPTNAIDLIWHTHMLFPLEYEESTRRFAGRFLNHVDRKCLI